jgi:hypothetical protein
VDVHLLGSASLAPCTLWTSDRQLLEAARSLRIAADPSEFR